MKERPIIFQSESIRAILAGLKTQTRRVIKPQPEMLPPEVDPFGAWVFCKRGESQVWEMTVKNSDLSWACSYGHSQDRLWVKEAAWISAKNFCLQTDATHPEGRIVQYFATNNDNDGPKGYGVKLTPSIYLARWASRLTLEILSVRAERIQDITDQDVIAEGQLPTDQGREVLRERFSKGWDLINAKRGFSWQSNPWVWVIEFKHELRINNV